MREGANKAPSRRDWHLLSYTSFALPSSATTGRPCSVVVVGIEVEVEVGVSTMAVWKKEKGEQQGQPGPGMDSIIKARCGRTTPMMA